MKIKDKVRNVITSYPYEKDKSIDLWIEHILINILEDLKEEQQEKLEQKADKIDIKNLIERSDEKFEKIQKDFHIRFETLQKEMNLRFEAMNTRFETLQKEMNTRFEALQKEMNARFEAVNARFEAIEKRFATLQWTIGIGFTAIFLIISLSNIFKNIN